MIFILKSLIPHDKLCAVPAISAAIYERHVARMC